MGLKLFQVYLLTIVSLVDCSHQEWKNLPTIPSGKRAEYFLLHKDGGYKYAYDTGKGSFAKQLATPENEVEGHFAHSASGVPVDIKYTSGVRGYMPSILSPLPALSEPEAVFPPAGSFAQTENAQVTSSSSNQNEPNDDASYSFSYNSGNSARSESSDSSGYVIGQYSYDDNSGHHDLSYKAGPSIGFVVEGGSLSNPIGLLGQSSVVQLPIEPTSVNEDSDESDQSQSNSAVDLSQSKSIDDTENVQEGFVISSGQEKLENSSDEPQLQTAGDSSSLSSAKSDGSYSFSYDAGDSSRSESADVNGNVQGQYAYQNNVGHHDLSYKAGAETGFVVTGGSLSIPNGLHGKAEHPLVETSSLAQKILLESDVSSSDSNNADGSYRFSYDTADSSRSESADVNGNVEGQYAYQNNAGNHDLSYKAGSQTGFVITGGSLSVPNVPSGQNSSPPIEGVSLGQPLLPVSQASSSGSVNSDGSYSFSYYTGDSSRNELAAVNGNDHGQYANQNRADHHDLSYKPTAGTGFGVTYGRLSVPSGLSAHPQSHHLIAPAELLQAPLGNSDSSADLGNSDRSYSFVYDAGNSSRSESSDADGNVHGQYTYQDSAGYHDLSYQAGAETGFVVISGSLSAPNGLQSPPELAPSKVLLPAQETQLIRDGSSPGSINSDPSYSYSFDAGDSPRRDSGDSSANVESQYGYQNNAGRHDLSYKSLDNTRFIVTGGNLAVPHGPTNLVISPPQLIYTLKPNNQHLPPLPTQSEDKSEVTPNKVQYKSSGLNVVNYLPVKSNLKVGYILN